MSAFDTETDTIEFENLAKLAENLVYRLPGCADLMIRKTLQDVYRDFCRRSCCLRGRRQFTISSSDTSVSCAPKYGGVIDCITDVTVGDHHRRLINGRDIEIDRNCVELKAHIIPSEDQTLELYVDFVEMPKINSEQVPSWFIQKYGEAVVSGVLSRLMAMTGKPWTDAQQAVDERLRYENAVNETRVRYYAQNEDGDLGCAVDYSGLI